MYKGRADSYEGVYPCKRAGDSTLSANEHRLTDGLEVEAPCITAYSECCPPDDLHL